MILITGSAGYIGSHIANYLYKKKIPFIGIDNFSAGNEKNYFHRYTKKIDIGDKKLIKKLIKKYKISNVIHTAALSYPVEGEKKRRKYKNNNYYKTLNFINSFNKSKINSFIFLSSSNVYSDKSNSPYKEKDKTLPKNIYGKYKLLIEKNLKKKKFFKKVIILRLFNVVGFTKKFNFKLHKSKNQRFITKIINSAFGKKYIDLNYFINKKKMHSPKRDFVHIDDVTKIIYLINKKLQIFSKYSIFNIGSGKKTSLDEILKSLEKKLKKKIFIKKKTINSKELNVTWCSKNKVERKLSIKIKNKMKDILNSSIDNYIKNDRKNS
tara:strand:- start:3171 stop:4139 length:969 start_codon:yes stop_codon:yes gene_type:complete